MVALAEHPLVRSRAMRELLDRPAADDEVEAARGRIAESKAARRFFERRHPEGYCLQRSSAGVMLERGRTMASRRRPIFA